MKAKSILCISLLILMISSIACESFEDQVSIDDYNKLLNEYNTLLAENQTAISDYNNLTDEYNSLFSECQDFAYGALTPPYINISERKVHLVFKRLNGELDQWEVPFDSLESDSNRGFVVREFIPEMAIPLFEQIRASILPVCSFTNCTAFMRDYNEAIAELEGMSLQWLTLQTKFGNTRVVDCRPFIDTNVFGNVIKPLYSESSSADEFIREVWNIVTQLNSYSAEIEETPRYPLETLLAGGGDCEDTAILFASMIKAAPVNWKVELVYMDLDNPSNAISVNHVIVSVDTGNASYLVETTNDQTMCPFTKVEGWHFEI